MATQTPTITTGLMPYRLTVRQFSKIIDANVFNGDRVELLAGALYAMTINLPHEFAVAQLGELLRPRLPAEWSLREEKPVKLDRFWRPQPDIAVVRSPLIAFADHWPQPRDIALLVEVSDTSYLKDAGIKLQRYASARIPLFWIVHLDRRHVEVCRDPNGLRGKANYRHVEVYPDNVEVPVVLDGQDLGRLAMRDLLR